MPVNQIVVERWSMVSPKPFAEIVAALDDALGHPDMREFGMNVTKANSWQELEHVVRAAIGRSGFMEFARLFALNPSFCLDKKLLSPGGCARRPIVGATGWIQSSGI